MPPPIADSALNATGTSMAIRTSLCFIFLLLLYCIILLHKHALKTSSTRLPFSCYNRRLTRDAQRVPPSAQDDDEWLPKARSRAANAPHQCAPLWSRLRHHPASCSSCSRSISALASLLRISRMLTMRAQINHGKVAMTATPHPAAV